MENLLRGMDVILGCYRNIWYDILMMRIRQTGWGMNRYLEVRTRPCISPFTLSRH